MNEEEIRPRGAGDYKNPPTKNYGKTQKKTSQHNVQVSEAFKMCREDTTIFHMLDGYHERKFCDRNNNKML